MAYYLRWMRKEDISQVNRIDHEAFPTLWPPPNYRRELENRMARYIVAFDEEQKVEEPETTPKKETSGLVSRLRQFFNHGRFFGNELPASGGQYIYGFAGCWIVAGEAHITNIAVREQHRRQGIGESLLIALIDISMELGAELITLEVRASNTAAQNLYAKYGFIGVGVRRGYYTDNREDGVLMSLQNVTSTPVQAKLQQLKQAHSRKWGAPTTALSPSR